MEKKLLFLSALLIVSFAVFAVSPKLELPKRQVVLSESARLDLTGKIVTELSTKSTPANAKAASTVPYFYSFETATIANDGWLITDASSKMLTTTDPAAPYGNYELFSNYNSAASRNAWAFSPAITLTTGVEYHVSIYVKAPGYSGVKDEFKITVGTDQTLGTQTTVIIDKSGANSALFADWTVVRGTFIPTTDGDYYFGINHSTVELDVEAVEFDGFAVNAGAEFVYPPNAHIFNANGGLWSATQDTVYVSSDETLNYQSITKASTSRLWSFTNATPSSSEDSLVNVEYYTAGSNTAQFEATGLGGTTTSESTINVIRPANGITDLIWNMTPQDIFTVYTLSTNNYVVGMNTYYKRVGEKYTIPSNVTVNLNSVSLYVGAYNITNTTNRGKNVVINIYPVGTDGLPITSTVLGTYTTTFATLFGTTAITNATLKTYTLATPLSITGSFFIEVNFAANTATTSTSNKLGLYSSAERNILYNTAYAYYSSAWQPLSSILTDFNVSSLIMPNLSFTTPIATSVTNPTKEDFNVFVNNGILNVENATAGTAVSVYDVAGKLAYSNVITNVNSALPLDLKAGVYVVKVADTVSKVVIK